MQTIRAFIAVDIPPLIREKIAERQHGFKSLELDASWVKPDNFHLTLKFLGNISPNRISEIKESLQATLAVFPAFATKAVEIGVFPSLDRPRVLWVSLEDQAFAVLKNTIDQSLAQIGFEPESKKFMAHLTLGRIKSSRNQNKLRETLKTRPALEIEPFRITSVKLYASQLTPKGSIYTLLEEFQLRALA